MADNVKFSVDLVDGVTGPSKRASSALSSLGNGAKKAGDVLGRASKGIIKGFAAVPKAITAVSFAFNQVSDAAQRVFGAIDSLAQLQRGAEGAEAAFAQYGESGKKNLESIRDTAHKVGGSMQELNESVAKNLGRLDPAELEYLSRVAGDAAKKTGQGFNKVFDGLSEKIAEFKNKKLGDLGFPDIQQLLKETGISTEQLTTALNTTPKGLERGLKNGKIDLKDIVNAIDKVNSMGGRAGNLGVTESANNLADTVQRVKNTWDGLLISFAEGAFSKELLADVNAFLTPEKLKAFGAEVKDIGLKFLEVSKAIFSAIGAFKGFVTTNWKLIEAGLGGIAVALAVGLVPALWAAIPPLVTAATAALVAAAPFIALGAAVAGLIYYWDDIVGFFDNVGKAIGNFVYDFADVGSQVIDGLMGGLTRGRDKVVGFVKGLGSSIKDTFKDVLGIHSPSKVFFEAGLNTTEGLRLGVKRGQWSVLSEYKRLGATMGKQSFGSGQPSFAVPGHRPVEVPSRLTPDVGSASASTINNTSKTTQNFTFNVRVEGAATPAQAREQGIQMILSARELLGKVTLANG